MLFVFGAPRSGTTYLGRLLEEIFDFGMGPEGTFVNHLARHADDYSNLDEDENLARLVDEVYHSEMLTIMRDKWRPEIRTDINRDMINDRLDERSVAGVIRSTFACVAREQGRTRVGNKNPGYWQALPAIDAIFGDRARYLSIVRDGRDVAISNMKMTWGANNILACANTWNKCIAATLDFARQQDSSRFLQIRYETLLDDPKTVVHELADFLGAEPDPDFNAHLQGKTRTGLKHGNHGKWASQLSPDQQRIFEALAGEHLRALGYVTRFERPRIGALERCSLEGRELWRKIILNLSRG